MRVPAKKVPPLTPEQQAFVVENQKLAYYLARKFYSRNPFLRRLGRMEDAEAEALHQLCRAAATYDPTLGIKASTYAAAVIHHGLISAARETGLLKVGEGTIAKEWKRLGGKHGPAYRAAFHVYPFSRVGCGHTDQDPWELYTWNPRKMEEETRHEEELLAVAEDALDSLKSRWRDVIRYRCAGWTLEECAKRLGVSKQRVEQIEKKAQRKLRTLAASWWEDQK